MEVECEGLDLEKLVESLNASPEQPLAANLTYESKSAAGIGSPEELEGQELPDLQYFNGIGGFNDENEYEIRLSGDELPPAPWINVIANASGGFVASETGAGATWAVSSSSFRLSPWHNDPVCDGRASASIVRDDDSGALWTPTPAPIREESRTPCGTARDTRSSSTITKASRHHFEWECRNRIR